MRALWMLLAVVGIATNGPHCVAAEKDEAEIQGTWVVISTECEGEAFVKKGDRFKLTEGKITLQTDAKDRPPGTYRLDSAKMPREFDLLPRQQENPSSKIVLRGIYQFEKDQLQICIGEIRGLAGRGSRRPTEFKSGPNQALLILKREAAEKSQK